MTALEVDRIDGRDYVKPLGLGRTRWIDGARGLSIVGMMLSHVLIVAGLAWWPLLHLTLWRPVAPVFFLLFGILWRSGWRRRHWQLLAGALVAHGFAVVLGFPLPDVLAVIVGLVLVMPLCKRWPHAAIALAVTQLAFWPMPELWGGFAPGFAVALATAGATVPADGFVRAWGNAGVRLGLEVVGRHPLAWYLGHLATLSLFVLLLGRG